MTPAIARIRDGLRRGAFALALLSTLSLAGCGRDDRREGSEAARDEHAEGEHAGETMVTLSPEAVRNAGIVAGVVAPATIATVVETPGEVHLNAERVLEVRPRYAGVIREMRKRIGDAVQAGEVVAIVQGNESLTDFEVSSAMAGTVIARPVVTGQAVDRESVLLTVADLTSVWADFAVYPQFVGRIRRGQPVVITAQNRPELRAEGAIHYVGPLLEQDTRVSIARAVLANERGDWQPGLFVTARVELGRARVALAVPDDAIVRTADGSGVFVVTHGGFVLRPVTLGRSDDRFREVLSGLAPGDSVVIANAFILKSELAKGEVEHEH